MIPKRLALAAFVLFNALIGASFTFAPKQPGTSKAIDLIVIDPGHGGKDPGAIGAVAYEKTVALQVSLKVKEKFSGSGIKIMMTRADDSFVGLYERAEMANTNKADLFISIHCNANTNKSAYGTETFAVGVHKEDAQLDVMIKENSSILLEKNYQEKYDNFDPKSAESYIMFQLLQHAYLTQSLQLAKKIETNYANQAKRHSRGVRQAGFLVLWKTSMPSVLTEIGFISNPTEEKFLVSGEGQEHIASCIYKACIQYKNEVE